MWCSPKRMGKVEIAFVCDVTVSAIVYGKGEPDYDYEHNHIKVECHSL